MIGETLSKITSKFEDLNSYIRDTSKILASSPLFTDLYIQM